MTTGAVSRRSESELDGLDGAQLAEPTPIPWSSFDGRSISGLYYLL
ncbi:MAG: hypothetical protein HY703_00630 [Gemmatimonadetes bacterium]|nr:hypothetical protein [Gemmatimonadota bacterium]